MCFANTRECRNALHARNVEHQARSEPLPLCEGVQGTARRPASKRRRQVVFSPVFEVIVIVPTPPAWACPLGALTYLGLNEGILLLRCLCASLAILRQVLADGLVMSVWGAGIGLGAGLLLARLLGSVLYEVGPADPWAYAAAAPTLIAVVLVASLIPALRAARLHPMDALREG